MKSTKNIPRVLFKIETGVQTNQRRSSSYFTVGTFPEEEWQRDGDKEETVYTCHDFNT